MAGSRFQRFGTIFSRMTGLLESGAIKSQDKPIWYDVYKAFPPSVEPKMREPPADQKVIEIFYPEDIIRAKIYDTFEENGLLIDLKRKDYKSLSQTFIEEYVKNMADNKDDDIFEKTENELQTRGLNLRRKEVKLL